MYVYTINLSNYGIAIYLINFRATMNGSMIGWKTQWQQQQPTMAIPSISHPGVQGGTKIAEPDLKIDLTSPFKPVLAPVEAALADCQPPAHLDNSWTSHFLSPQPLPVPVSLLKPEVRSSSSSPLPDTPSPRIGIRRHTWSRFLKLHPSCWVKSSDCVQEETFIVTSSKLRLMAKKSSRKRPMILLSFQCSRAVWLSNAGWTITYEYKNPIFQIIYTWNE